MQLSGTEPAWHMQGPGFNFYRHTYIIMMTAKANMGQVWWHTSVIPALRKLKQKNQE
jgi:hypothetical protein